MAGQGAYGQSGAYGGYGQTGAVIVCADGMEPAPDPTCLAAVVCFVCCWCLGIIAILKSRQVANFNMMGDYANAHEARRQAMQWIYITIGTGVILHIIQFAAAR